MGRWLALRGLGRESAHWLEFGDKLRRHSPDSLFIDLPGAGTRLTEKSPITIAAITDKVRDEFLRRKGASKDEWNILGISLGGMVALDWAKRYPYDFKSLTVMNVSSKDTGAIWQRLSAFGLYKILQSLAQDKPRTREQRILEMVSNLRTNDPKTLDALETIATARPMSVQNLVRQVFAASNFLAPESLRLPVLILASLKDNMVDVRCSKKLAEQLSAQIKFHPEAGHELSMDDPDWCMDRLLEFEMSLAENVVPSP